MDSKEYQDMVEKIVQKEFPDEIEAFKLEADSLIRDQLQGHNILKPDSETRGEFQFMTEATAILNFVGLLWSTYEVLKKFKAEFQKSKNKQIDIDSLKTNWKTELIASGIRDNIASEISEEFVHDLARLTK